MSVAFVRKLPAVIQDTAQLTFIHLDIMVARSTKKVGLFLL